MISTLFGTRASADLDQSRQDGVSAWSRLVREAVDENADPGIDELRAAGAHLEGLSSRELIDRFTVDCAAVRQIRAVEAEIADYRRLVQKARKPETVMSEIVKLEEKVDGLKAEFELADGFSVGLETKQLELRRIVESNPHLGG